MRGATRDRGDAVAARVFTDTYGVRDGRERLPVEFYVATSPASMVKLTCVNIAFTTPTPTFTITRGPISCFVPFDVVPGCFSSAVSSSITTPCTF
mmetsp:Transcript_34150/g.77369  ORF Transcript_34150/g.77369 Transcript_34150/m.77369 type:complete len:95 (-) Transcript_34150:401-685(-)